MRFIFLGWNIFPHIDFALARASQEIAELSEHEHVEDLLVQVSQFLHRSDQRTCLAVSLAFLSQLVEVNVLLIPSDYDVVLLVDAESLAPMQLTRKFLLVSQFNLDLVRLADLCSQLRRVLALVEQVEQVHAINAPP